MQSIDSKTCPKCGNDFGRTPGMKPYAFARKSFCSQSCARSGRGTKLPQTYEVTGLGCWEWTGYIDRNGYARGYDETKPAGQRVDWAHRIYYRKTKGPIPAGRELDHLCENTRCVNPEHLEPVTKAEHAFRTMQRAGAGIREKQAAYLRKLGLTYADIAKTMNLLGKESAFSAVNSAIRNGHVSAEEIPRVHHLSPEDREDITDLYRMGVPQTELAKWYGIDSSQVSRVCAGKTGGHAA